MSSLFGWRRMCPGAAGTAKPTSGHVCLWVRAIIPLSNHVAVGPAQIQGPGQASKAIF